MTNKPYYMRFIQYNFPRIYEFSLKLLHGKNLTKRYKYIAKNIEKGSNVLDIGCGTGLLGKFISKKCNYIGIDLNEKFLDFASKRGLKVFKCDALNFKKYSKNIDTMIICDVLHHIYPKHKKLLKTAMKYSKKIIICEPYAYEKKPKKSFLERIKTILILLFDSDGINPIRFEKIWSYTKDDLKTFFRKTIKNRKELALKEIGGDIVAIYKL